jgi:hypothetical protein
MKRDNLQLKRYCDWLRYFQILTEERKGKMKDIFCKGIDKFQKWGFWILLLFLCGFIVGAFSMDCYKKALDRESTILGSVIIDKKVYDIKERLTK